MRNRVTLVALLLLVLCPAVCMGVEPAPAPRPWTTDTITGPTAILPFKLIDHAIAGDWQSAMWEVAPEGKADIRIAADGRSVTWTAPPGTYTLEVIVVNFDKKTIGKAKKVVTIGVTPPVPPDPVPPDPVPPTPGDGLRVLIVEDPLARAGLAAAQREIIMSIATGSVVDYMTKNCKTVNNVPEWRILDASHLDMSKETKDWQDAAAKWKTLNLKVPSWIVTDGATADAGPLPATPAEALVVLKKHTKGGK
jgi:hypothetical protein